MPRKNGRFTTAERIVARELATSGSVVLAAQKSGLSTRSVQRHIADPKMLAEVAREHQEMLFRDILPMAIAAHKRLLQDTRTPPGALVQAVKLAYDQTFGTEQSVASKEAHELSPEELAASIATLERIASDRAKAVNAAGSLDIFG